ncbi:glycosyltransferase family 4 protein [Haladaptatus sp. YSMS36]|uniref:glycosyltransferase family 4 protein n=1 Tax=Haladaptatus sp. YSMS36 TaxID=3033384 RepID=UPI0023E7B27A|nr:glycosyltransferase family 4 protein [Haladaptatus sp. YSMS36]
MSIRILAVTDLREEEISTPLQTSDGSKTVSIEQYDGIVRKYIYLSVILIRELYLFNYDCILVYNGVGLVGLVPILFGKVSTCPVVSRMNGDVFRQHEEHIKYHMEERNIVKYIKYSSFSRLTKYNYSQFDGHLVVSPHLRDLLIDRLGCGQSLVRFVPNPKDRDKFLTNGNRFDGDNIILLTVANYNFYGKYRGTLEIANSIEQLLENNDNIEFRIAGGGKYYKEMEIHMGEINGRINCLGYVDEIQYEYEAADILLYNSYIDGAPNVILEGQLCGLPIISNSLYGMRYQITHQETGLLVDTPEEFVEWVEFLIENKDYAKSLGDQARSKAISDNCPQKIGMEMVTAIKQIVSSGTT